MGVKTHFIRNKTTLVWNVPAVAVIKYNYYKPNDICMYDLFMSTPMHYSTTHTIIYTTKLVPSTLMRTMTQSPSIQIVSNIYTIFMIDSWSVPPSFSQSEMFSYSFRSTRAISIFFLYPKGFGSGDISCDFTSAMQLLIAGRQAKFAVPKESSGLEKESVCVS